MMKSKQSGSVPRQCALCAQDRTHGSLLRATDADETDSMWVCDDCQHKLTRRVDDEGVKGG